MRGVELLRFDFFYEVCEEHPRRVLNVGSNDDGGPGLREAFGPRIVNCDIETHDSKVGGRPNYVDLAFNCMDTWPLPDDSAEIALFGDVLEHLTPTGILEALTAARRVVSKVAITVPEDTRINEAEMLARWSRAANNSHTTILTAVRIGALVEDAGWQITRLVSGNWGVAEDPHQIGHCLEAVLL